MIVHDNDMAVYDSDIVAINSAMGVYDNDMVT